MKYRHTQCGFTLIELLVVVLIIGILAAIAIPQYQKAVGKARVTEAIVQINSLEKAISLYVLENGYQDVHFLGTAKTADLDLELNIPDTYLSQDGGRINNHYYEAKCYSDDYTCSIYMEGPDSTDDSSVSGFSYVFSSNYKNGHWERICESFDALGVAVCNSLETNAWEHRAF